jgi:winged helix DNA-binding protein
MTFAQIPRYRLHNQRLTGTKFKTAAEVVRWFGAVQAQDYLGALWAIGLRMQNATETAVEQALAQRTIVRTWPMRGTLHFVAAEDARWILKLLTPRLLSRSSLLRQLELDERVLGRCRDIFVNALGGGKQLSRVALYEQLERNGIATKNTRGLHIVCQLAQEGFICFGAREGKQQTFTLLEEWLPVQKTKERDEALASLARRYFTSHGPATSQDFVWWSGLRVADAKAAIEMSKRHLVSELIDGTTHWLAPSASHVKPGKTSAYLLPPFDEYTVAYKDRAPILSSKFVVGSGSPFALLGPTIVIDGKAVGSWKRAFNKSATVISANFFKRLSKNEMQVFRAAAEKYGDFAERRIEFS